MATITTATSGDSNATGTWTGGVVPVSGDKVVIAHPGTNTLASTAYTLNGAASLGATTIPVAGGSGTIVAGECVQFDHQIGSDEDGQPIYDNTYYRVTTGITGAGSLVITPGLAYSMASGVSVANRGHVVTLEASHTWGDDTSSLTPANNAIAVSGTLRASRTTSQTLRVRGTLFLGDNATLDYGDLLDIIPAGVTTVLELNDSASMSSGKHGLTSNNRANTTWKMRGVKRTRNTRLTNSTGAGATSIMVDDSVSWGIGDRLVVASDTDDPTRSQIVTITGGSSPTWTVSAITNARPAGLRIGNLSSNLTVKATTDSAQAFVSMYRTQASTAGLIRVGDIRVENCGAGGWTGLSANPTHYGMAMVAGGPRPATGYRIAVELTHGNGVYCLSNYIVSRAAPHKFEDVAAYGVSASLSCKQIGDGGSTSFVDVIGYRSAVAFSSSFGAGAVGTVVSGGEDWCASIYASTCTVDCKFQDGYTGHATGRVVTGAVGAPSFANCTLYAPKIYEPGPAQAAAVVLRNCVLSSALLTANNTVGNIPAQSAAAVIDTVNGDASDNRVLSYFQTTITDTSTRKRSTYAVKLQPKVANTAITYVFTIPAVSGVAQTIKGSLRFDATYGTATPPSIALSGQGVTSSFTAPATADAWHDFSFSFTPTNTGDITATVTVQSTSTSGYAWLDGVWHYPMTQSVRHFGYQWLLQAAQVADSRITLTEAAALALPIVVDHGAETITITGSATAREVFEHCIADLCQTGNQGEAVHISSATGATFATTYTVVGDVVGVYTDTTGTSASLTLAGLQDASVLLVDGSGATVEFQAAQSGEFDYVYKFAPGATGTWRWVAKAPGREHATGTFTPGAGGAFSYAPVLTQKLTPSGDPMYTGTTSALVSVSIPGTTNAYIDIGDGTAPLQESFNEAELALVTQAGLEWLAAGKDDVSVFDSGSGDYLFLTAGWRLRRASAGDANAAIEAYVTSADGAIVDDTNGPVLYLTSNTPAAIAAAVWAYIDRELTQAIPTAAQIADTMLGRNLAGGSDGGRTVRDALRASRNKSAISGSTLTVYQEDDATPAWTAAVSTAERDALQSIDPA